MTGGAKPRWFFANLVRVGLSQQAGGQMSVVEFAGPPGDMPPLHLHKTDDEAWYVLGGEMSFFVGDNEPTRIEAGAIAFGSRASMTHAGLPSARRVTSSASSSPPAERDGLPPHGDPPSEQEVAAGTALAAEYGIELLGPPGALP